MKVSTTEPFKIIYSLFEHQYLGYLFESFVVQLNSRGELTYAHQNVSYRNIKEFSNGVDAVDIELVKYMDAIQQDAILKKFNPKKLKAVDYFLKVYDTEKGDKELQEVIDNYITKHMAEIMPRLIKKDLFIMANDGQPTWKKMEVMQEKAKVYFNFERNEEHTIYYPIVKCGDEKVKIQFTGAQILSDKPAFILIDTKLYHFDNHVTAKKLKPFFNKSNIQIDRKIEDTYYRKFVGPLIAQFNVFARGFDIFTEEHPVKPILFVTENLKSKVLNLFGGGQENNLDDPDAQFQFELIFEYGDYHFKFDSLAAYAYVNISKTEDSWQFIKVLRNLDFERSIFKKILDIGLNIVHGKKLMPKYEAFSFLQQNYQKLADANIEIRQSDTAEKQYFIGTSSIEINIVENRDWFDLQTKVSFGDFELSFLALRELVLAGKREFRLPDGRVAVIPEEWFTRYYELFNLSELTDDMPILEKHHLSLVQNLEEDGLARTVIDRKLLSLQNFDQIGSTPMPKGFKGELRPYQKAGYDWMHFLRSYNFGGCLADDMGLGKTVMTLAFLQSIKEAGAQHPCLLVMPTSLIYNWEKEADKFTPKLKVLKHTGSNRAKNTKDFKNYDLILCSYGVLRLDIDFIEPYRFEYVILDESQAIKNPSSNISQVVRMLNTKNRLILTGTPLENSTMDLWTQITFINPGLLGSQVYFRNTFQLPIEKQQNEEATQKLYARIKPFILRRHKSQVATELPEKIETVQYCDMSEEQEKVYEETKANYRNLILKHIEEKGLGKSQMMVLQGLTKLRQLANNPLMVDENYEGLSGKDSDVMHKLRSVLEGGHKTLIFSQFVKHLGIIKQMLEANKISYVYLDGATKDREKQVTAFQENLDIMVFLISLKAGGVGLNLTAAEYVFLLDPWWNPAIEAQAVDRAHRIGQKNTVFTYKFISRNTVEEKILALQQNKKRLFDELITTEESFMKNLSQNDIINLLA